jgi:hypothetical protein
VLHYGDIEIELKNARSNDRAWIDGADPPDGFAERCDSKRTNG